MKTIAKNAVLLLIAGLLSTQMAVGQSCPGYKTYTQGGWSSTPTGTNPGVYLNNRFAAAFPSGLTIGCTRMLKLTSPTAIRNFLPSNGTPSQLPAGTLTNPTRTSYSNVLAGQLVTLALTLRFDEFDPNFAPSTSLLRDLRIASGPFRGWTVGQLFTEANKKIGGCASANFTFAQYNDALTLVNQNYDNGSISGNFLACQLVITGTPTNPLCFGSNTGSITLNVQYGVPPYTFLWSNGATTQNLTGIGAGNYSVVVTDAIGATASQSFTITQPSLVIATSVAGTIACNGGTASVVVTASGGTPPYSGAGTFSTTAGNYTYTVTDANGCTATTSVSITQPSPLFAVITLNAARICSGPGCDGSGSVQVTGGTAPYSYLWTNGSTDVQVTGLCAGTSIGVRVTDANGCFYDTDPSIEECVPECEPLTTFTQGGWGAEPNGNNPGDYLHANFDGAFPDGVTIGCDNTLTLTTAQAVTDWLPSGTTPSALPEGDLVDDLTYDNVLASQLVAATLNVGFDAYDTAFDASADLLADRYLSVAPFEGMTVGQLLLIANEVIGGCSDDYSYSELNAALTAVNENYDNGTSDQGDLSCTPPSFARRGPTEGPVLNSVFPVPAHDSFTVTLEAEANDKVELQFHDITGRKLDTHFEVTRSNANVFQVRFNPMSSQMVLMTITTAGKTTTKSVFID
ncbi:MAG: SprB repeat-containing protein [Bacteroidota bacterium]